MALDLRTDAPSRFGHNPNRQEALITWLANTLLSTEELDIEIRRHQTCATASATAETDVFKGVLHTAIECPAPMPTDPMNRAGVPFYDFCNFAKMCSECGKMAVGANKMKICQGCRIDHLCDRACQKAHWAKKHRTECKTRSLSRDLFKLVHFCSQIATCMFIWGRLDDDIGVITRKMCEVMQNAGLHDVLWLVSYKHSSRTVVFSTIPRDVLANCIGKAAVEAGDQQSGVKSQVVLIVPSKQETTGQIVFTLVPTFLQIEFERI